MAEIKIKQMQTQSGEAFYPKTHEKAVVCENGKRLSEVLKDISGGTNDYNSLINKPQINSVELNGNKTLEELGIQAKGEYALSSQIEDKADRTEIADMLTKTEAGSLYQPKGEYLTQGDADAKYETKQRVSEIDETVSKAFDVFNKSCGFGESGTYTPTSELISGATSVTEALDIVADSVNSIEKINNAGNGTVTKELEPNKFYTFGECASLTITLATEIKNIYNEYMFEFTSGSTPTTLNLPETIKWIGKKTIEANKRYQVSIVNNIAVMGGSEK